MKYAIITYFLFFLSLTLLSQDKSIQQLQSEKYIKYNFTTEHEFDGLNSYHYTPQSSLPLSRQVFGWNPYWAGTAYNNYNYNLLSTVAYFSYEVDTATGGYTTIHFWR